MDFESETRDCLMEAMDGTNTWWVSERRTRDEIHRLVLSIEDPT
jgi:hypothetical protein